MKKFVLKEPSNPFARAVTLLIYGSLPPLMFLLTCAVGTVLLVFRTGRFLKNLTVRYIGHG